MKTAAGRSITSLDRILESIGKLLIELRLRQGYKSYAAFAEAHNLPRIQYWRMEKGKANITLRSLHRVLAIHDLSMEDLFLKIKDEDLG
jgi:transcriptional regulator with XRE-family HTH domain